MAYQPLFSSSTPSSGNSGYKSPLTQPSVQTPPADFSYPGTQPSSAPAGLKVQEDQNALTKIFIDTKNEVSQLAQNFADQIHKNIIVQNEKPFVFKVGEGLPSIPNTAQIPTKEALGVYSGSSQAAESVVQNQPVTPGTYAKLPFLKQEVQMNQGPVGELIKGLVETPERIVTSIPQARDLLTQVSVLSKDGKNYPGGYVQTYQDQHEAMRNLALANGFGNTSSEIIGSLYSGASAILDVTAVYGLLTAGAKAALLKLPVEDASHQVAWQTLGMPATLDEAKMARNTILKEVHPDFGKATASADLTQKVNEAYKILEAKGIPVKPSLPVQILKKGLQKLAGVSDTGVQAPYAAPAGYLPGTAVEHPNAPIGFSTQEVTPVGYVSPLEKPSVATNEPQMIHHGTSSNLQDFQNGFLMGKNSVYGRAAFFTDSPKTKTTYGDNVISLIKNDFNLKIIDSIKEQQTFVDKMGVKNLSEAIQKEGKYDGFIIPNKDASVGNTYGITNQIKLDQKIAEFLPKIQPVPKSPQWLDKNAQVMDYNQAKRAFNNGDHVVPINNLADEMGGGSPIHPEIKSVSEFENPNFGQYYVYQDAKTTPKPAQGITNTAKQTNLTSYDVVNNKIDELNSQRNLLDPQGQVESEILAELDQAQAGKRIFIQNDQMGINKVVAQKSSFPKWVSEDLRSRKLFDEVMSSITEKKIPTSKKAVALYTEVLNEENKRLQIDRKFTEEDLNFLRTRPDIKAKNAYLSDIQSQIVKKLTEKLFSRPQLAQRVAQAKEAGMIKGAREQKILEQRVARRQVAVEKRTAKRHVRQAIMETREQILEQLRVKMEEIGSVKKQIVDYANKNLPLNERGKLLALVKNAQTQKNLIDAFLRIDEKVSQIALSDAIIKLKESINKFSDSPSVSVDYRNKIKEVLNDYELTGHTNKTMEKIQATQKFLERAQAIGEDTALPQKVLDRLAILGRTPKDQLTLDLIQKLQAEVDLLAQLGQTKLNSRTALYENEKRLRTNELLQSVSPIKSLEAKRPALGETPTMTEDFAKQFINLRNKLQKTQIGLKPMDGLADITGMVPMKDALDLGFSNYLTWNDERFAKVDEIVKRNGLTETDFKYIGAYAIAQQEGGMERLIQNNGITAEDLNKLSLSKEQKELYDFMRSEFDAAYPAIKKWAEEEFNADVGKVDNYVSFQTDFEAMNDLQLQDRFGSKPEEARNKFFKKNVESGFKESRASMASNPLELDISKIFTRHFDNVAYALTMSHDIQMYFEILNNPELQTKLGDVGTLAWKQWIDLMARKGGVDGAQRIAVLDTLRKNLSLGVMTFRISSAVVQLTSFADTVGTIGSEYAMKGATSIATSKEWRAFISDNFPEVKKAVGDDLAFREFGNSFLENLGKKGLIPLEILDGLMRATAAAGAYQKLAFERGIPVDLANPNQELIQEATKFMRYSQGSSFFKDQPLSITSGYGLLDNKSLNKTILTFQSFMLNRWDNMKRNIWRLGIKEKDYKKAFMSFFWLIVVAGAMESELRKGVKKGVSAVTTAITGVEDTSKSNGLMQDIALNTIQAVPIVGSLVSSMMYSSNPIPIVNALEDTTSGITNAVTGKTSSTKLKGIVRAGGGIGSLLGIPGVSQTAQIIKGGIQPSSGGKSKFGTHTSGKSKFGTGSSIKSKFK